MVMLLRIIFECMSQDNNYFLVGRTTYGEIHDVLIKEFMELCPPDWIVTYRKTPHPSVVLRTFSGKTSEIIFRNLDGLSQGELLGLNLGGFAIDQAEDVPEKVFMTLKGRLRRASITHRVFMTSNPKLSWLYRAFKQRPEDNYELIEASTLENEANLPPEYVADLMRAPESWRRQYVEGVWDESLLSDKTVFAREHVEKLARHVRNPARVREGVDVFLDYDPARRYQIGVDSAEGEEAGEHESGKDSGVIVVWDRTARCEAACYAAKVPPRVLADKAVMVAGWYGNPEIVPEMNSMGSTILDRLSEVGYANVYRRQEYDKSLRKTTKKLGWRMTGASKALLISKFEQLLRLAEPKIFSAKTVEEFKTFVYTQARREPTAGAMVGFHDDRVVATLLAAFEDGEIRASVSGHPGGTMVPDVQLAPSLTVVNGRYKPPAMFAEKTARWTTL